MGDWFRGTFQDKDGHWSSKSQAGTFGVLVILACYVYVVYRTGQLPSVTEFMIASFVALLSVNKVSDAVSSMKNGGSGEKAAEQEQEG